MPKKTKKQKILAKLHRQQQLLKKEYFVNVIDEENSQKSMVKVKNDKIDSQNNLKKINNEDLILKKYFLIDFKKSFLIIVFIIALEIALYFVKLIK